MAQKLGPKLWGPSSVHQPNPQPAGPRACLRNSDYLQPLTLPSQPEMERPPQAPRRQLSTHCLQTLKLRQKEFLPVTHQKELNPKYKKAGGGRHEFNHESSQGLPQSREWSGF